MDENNQVETEVRVEDSILLSTKKYLGIEPDITHFDPDIIMCINSALNVLTQLGVGPSKGFSITSKDDTWESLLEGDERLNMVKSYISLKTKLMFDPPNISAVLQSYKEQIAEYECRINYQADYTNAFD